MQPVLLLGLGSAEERLLPVGSLTKRGDKALLLAFIALFQLKFERSLFAQLVLDAQQNAGQLLLFERFEQIILHPVFERALRVFKLAVSADHDEMQIGLQLLCAADQLDPVAAGHADVGDQQLGLFVAHQLERTQAVVGSADDFIAERLPVDQLAHEQDHLVFVVCKNNLYHNFPPGNTFLHSDKKRENETVSPFP